MRKKLREWVDLHAGSVWFSCLWNLLLLAGLLLIFRPAFETNDDISISMIANGAWGTHDAHVICQNYLLGLFYTALYKIGTNRFPWYTYAQFAAVYAALTTVTYVIFARMKKWQHAFLVSGTVLLFFGYECYISMQYTKTAGIMLGAGIFLMFYELEKEKCQIGGLLFGMWLAVWGSLYRFEEALVCMALMAGLGLYFLLTLKRWKEKRNRRLLTCVLSFGILLAAMGGTEYLDRQIYASDARWDYFMQYNDLRSNLTDYSIPAYADFEEEYTQLGITKTAYKIFRKGLNFYDPDVYPLDVLQKMDDLRPKNTLSRALVQQFFRHYPIGYLKIPVFLCFLILVLYWAAWGEKTGKIWLVAGFEICMMGAIDFYLFYAGRYLENRVETGLWFAISLVVIWFLKAEKWKLSTQTAWLMLACILTANQGSWNERWRGLTEQEEIDREQRKTMYEEVLSTDPDGLYLAKLGTVSYSGYGMLTPVQEGAFSSVVWYGGWEMGNPLWLDKMAQYGITNPYRDLINQEHVYLVDNNIELTLKYIHQYYDESAEAELVNESGNLKVYRITGAS